MDINIMRREKMREKWLEMAKLGMPIKPRAASKPNGLFQHFESEDQRQLHLQQVEEAQKNGAPF